MGSKTEGAKQQNLVITPEDVPAITVDNIEVAQFVYLLLHNEKGLAPAPAHQFPWAAVVAFVAGVAQEQACAFTSSS